MKNNKIFFDYTQNNTGGNFTVDKKLCHRILIEADSQEKANIIAKDMGIYFNGVSLGRDCECCGDRWYIPDKIIFPLKWDEKTYFENVEDYVQYLANEFGWTIPDGRIFYKNGKILEIKGDKR